MSLSDIHIENMSQNTFVAKISALLDTFEEAVTYLEKNDDPELAQGVSETRVMITEALEKKLSRSFESAICISKLTDQDWLITARHILDDIASPLLMQNYYDAQFVAIIKNVLEKSEDQLLADLKKALTTYRSSNPGNYDRFVAYFSKYPFWGSLSPDNNDYTALSNRVETVKRHAFDLIWLYKHLADYLSKTTLVSILYNWIYLDTAFPAATKSCFCDYWDPDIFPTNNGEVLVDVGAYTGDSIADYIRIYGQKYKKIIAYEISPQSVEILRNNVIQSKWHDIEIRQKGAGSEKSTLYVDESADISANRVSSEKSGNSVAIVPLDDEVYDDASFIKMDIEGAEQSALLGLKKTISDKHPKLAVCTYHGYEDIWKIPVMIDKMYPRYRFYLRHYGGNIIPTEFVLLCK